MIRIDGTTMSKPASLTCYVTDAVVNKIRRISERQRRSISFVTAELIEEALDRRELEAINTGRAAGR